MMTTLFMAALAVVAINASADELDPVAANVPSGLIIRTDAKGNQEVFKASVLLNKVVDNATATAAAKDFVKPENQVKNVANGSELDKVSSDDSWCRWYDYSYSYRPYNYSYYSYNHCGYSYSYYPTYSYYYGGYSYSYYYSSYHCGGGRGRW